MRGGSQETRAYKDHLCPAVNTLINRALRTVNSAAGMGCLMES